MPAVLHPLQYVSVHVVQTEPVRGERAHRERALAALVVLPASVAVRAAPTLLVSPPVPRPRPRPRHVLPLRFAQQPVRLPRRLRQPAHEGLRIRPAHVHHRPRPAPPSLVVGMVRTPAPAPACLPLRERHLVHAHRERLGNPHRMHRAFVAFPFAFARRTAHPEHPGRNHHQLRTLRTIANSFPDFRITLSAFRFPHPRQHLPPHRMIRRRQTQPRPIRLHRRRKLCEPHVRLRFHPGQIRPFAHDVTNPAHSPERRACVRVVRHPHFREHARNRPLHHLLDRRVPAVLAQMTRPLHQQRPVVALRQPILGQHHPVGQPKSAREQDRRRLQLRHLRFRLRHVREQRLHRVRSQVPGRLHAFGRLPGGDGRPGAAPEQPVRPARIEPGRAQRALNTTPVLARQAKCGFHRLARNRWRRCLRAGRFPETFQLNLRQIRVHAGGKLRLVVQQRRDSGRRVLDGVDCLPVLDLDRRPERRRGRSLRRVPIRGRDEVRAPGGERAVCERFLVSAGGLQHGVAHLSKHQPHLEPRMFQIAK